MSADFCTLLVATPDKVALPSQAEIQSELESPEVPRKVAALKKAILLLLSGEEMPRTVMSVIRYCITVEDHTLQKLLMLYWEVARKYDAAGKLLPEMILVCNALRNNLIHPNEYIRGSTLRFLCKLREPELLEPLVPTIKLCLSHRHAYVRRNAVLAVFSVFKHFRELYPDAPEDVEKLLEEESDAGTRRNAFVMMFQVALDRALAYLAKNLERVRGAERARWLLEARSCGRR
jgi:coatomer subunit beta